MIRAARLDTLFFEEIEKDTTRTREAAVVVAIVSLVSQFGLELRWGFGLGSIVLGVLWDLAGWFVWAAITLWIGTHLTRTEETKSDLGEMLRVLGYAQSPRMVLLLAPIPVLGWILIPVAYLWTLAAVILGIRAALDFSVGRAIVTAAVGGVVYLIVKAILQAII